MTIWSSGKTLVTDMAWCILVGNITSASPSFNFGQTCLPLTRVGKKVLSLALANQCVSRYIPRNQRLPRDLLRFILVTSRNDSRKHRYILYVNYVAPTRFSWSVSSKQIRFSRKICCTISTLYTVYLPLTSPPLVFAKTYPTNQKIRTQKGRYKRVRVKPPSLHLWQHHFDATPPLPRASSTAWNSRQMVFTWWKPLGFFFSTRLGGKILPKTMACPLKHHSKKLPTWTSTYYFTKTCCHFRITPNSQQLSVGKNCFKQAYVYMIRLRLLHVKWTFICHWI